MCACVCSSESVHSGPPARKRDTKPAMASPSREPEVEPSVQVQECQLSPQRISSDIDYWIANAHIDVSSQGLFSCMRCGTFCAPDTMLFGRRWEIDGQGVISRQGVISHPAVPESGLRDRRSHWLVCANCGNIDIEHASLEIRRLIRHINRDDKKLDSLDQEINDMEHALQVLREERGCHLDRLQQATAHLDDTVLQFTRPSEHAPWAMVIPRFPS